MALEPGGPFHHAAGIEAADVAGLAPDTTRRLGTPDLIDEVSSMSGKIEGLAPPEFGVVILFGTPTDCREEGAVVSR